MRSYFNVFLLLTLAACAPAAVEPVEDTTAADGEEIGRTGDWAFRRGAFAMAFSPAAVGDQLQDAGKYLEIWQGQTDGFWKIARDIWNSENPLP